MPYMYSKIPIPEYIARKTKGCLTFIDILYQGKRQVAMALIHTWRQIYYKINDKIKPWNTN